MCLCFPQIPRKTVTAKKGFLEEETALSPPNPPTTL